MLLMEQSQVCRNSAQDRGFGIAAGLVAARGLCHNFDGTVSQPKVTVTARAQAARAMRELNLMATQSRQHQQ